MHFRTAATIRGMRYVAVLLAVFVVAATAAAQEWNGDESAGSEPIELRPSEPPSETAATLLDLKPSPTTPSTGATVAAPAVQREATERAATQRALPPSRSQTLAPSRPRVQTAQPVRSVGAAPAPAAAPVPIQQTHDEDDDGGDDDDSDNGDGGGDDDD
jgi:hypothetical protein